MQKFVTNFLYKSIIDLNGVDSIDIPNIIRLSECSYCASATEKQHKTIINLKLIYFTGYLLFMISLGVLHIYCWRMLTNWSTYLYNTIFLQKSQFLSVTLLSHYEHLKCHILKTNIIQLNILNSHGCEQCY